MARQFTLNADGSLTVTELGPDMKAIGALGALVAVLDKDGAPVKTATTITMSAEQIARHRRDPAFEAELPAALKVALG